MRRGSQAGSWRFKKFLAFDEKPEDLIRVAVAVAGPCNYLKYVNEQGRDGWEARD